MKVSDVKVIFIIVIIFTILMASQCIRLMNDNFTLKKQIIELEEVIYVLDEKLERCEEKEIYN